MSAILPPELMQRLRFLRERMEATRDALDAHAQDVMLAGSELDTLAGVQLVKTKVEQSIATWSDALREAGASE